MANPFDQFDAPRANPFDQFDPGYKPPARSLFAVANDTVIETGNAIANAAAGIGNFIAPGNRVSQFIDEKIVKAGEAAQSDAVKAEKARFQNEVQGADGVMGELGAVAGYIGRNPLLTAAQAAGSFVVPGAAVKGAGALARGMGAGAAGTATAGMAGGATAGAALSGGDAAGTAYELAINAGASEEEAQAAARQASAIPAVVGGLGGVVGAERLLAGAGGVTGGAIARALKTAGIEGLQEGFEEGITQYEGQRAAQPFDPSIDPSRGVAAAAGMGAALGGVTGAGVSLLAGNQAPNVQATVAAQREAEADRALAEIGGATNVDQAIDSAMRAVPPVDGLVPAIDENQAMGQAAPIKTQADARAQREADRPPQSTEEPRPGDILSRTGKPFITMSAANASLKRAGPGYVLAPVRGGLVIRAADAEAAAPQLSQEADVLQARTAQEPGVPSLGERQEAVLQPEVQAVPPIRGPRDNDGPGMGEQLPGLLPRDRPTPFAETYLGPDQQRRELRAGQRALGDEDGAGQQPGQQPQVDDQRANADGNPMGPGVGRGPQAGGGPDAGAPTGSGAGPLPSDVSDRQGEVGGPGADAQGVVRASRDEGRYDLQPTAQGDTAGSGGVAEAGVAPPAGDVDREWATFPPESGTLGVPRAEMPQVKAEHRGAMVNFLAARGITHEQEADVDPRTLKATQAEYSLPKVQKALDFEGGDRAILVSADGHVLDGHHQWIAAMTADKPVRVIRLNAPIAELMNQVREFPSAETSEGAPNGASPAATGRPDEGSAGRGDQPGRSMEPARLLADEPGRSGGSGSAEPAVTSTGPDVAPGGRRVDDAVAAGYGLPAGAVFVAGKGTLNSGRVAVKLPDGRRGPYSFDRDEAVEGLKEQISTEEAKKSAADYLAQDRASLLEQMKAGGEIRSATAQLSGFNMRRDGTMDYSTFSAVARDVTGLSPRDLKEAVRSAIGKREGIYGGQNEQINVGQALKLIGQRLREADSQPSAPKTLRERAQAMKERAKAKKADAPAPQPTATPEAREAAAPVAAPARAAEADVPGARSAGVEADGVTEAAPAAPAAEAAEEADDPVLQDLNRIGTTIAAQGYEKTEVPRVQAARKLQGLLDKRDAGEISDGMFETSLRLLAQRLTEASDAKQANRWMAERERGADIVREKLIRARRQGDLEPEAVDFALWAIDQNPAIAERLGISVRAPKDNVAAGDYNPAAEIIRLFKGSDATGTAVHEILHHTERMMPADMQEAIRKEWAATLAKAMRKAAPEQAAALQNVIPAMAGDKASYKALVKAIQEGPLNYAEHYQLTNPSEFWAVNATALMAERFAARDSVWQRVATWFRETVQKARALVGMRSTAPLIRALDAVLEGDGSRQSKEMLSAKGPAGGNFQNITATLGDRLNDAKSIKLPAGYVVGDFFSKAGKVSWWHKTVGTMHNLAERSPPFKRVYDAAQQFLNDVSSYAAEAADLAPKILPKMESWRDLAKSPLSAEDTKALSAPVFEGTLVWTRDGSGKPVRVKDLEAQAAGMDTEAKARQMLREGKVTEAELKRWQALPLDSYEGAVRNRYESAYLRGGLVWTDAELKAQFGLTPAQIGLYREFRAATDRSLNDLGVSDMIRFAGKDAAAVRQQMLDAPSADAAGMILRDHLYALAEQNPERADVLNDTASKIVEKADKVRDLIAKGYAPLSRFGNYFVSVKKGDEQVFFSLYESKLAAAGAARRMRAEYPDAQVSNGTMPQEAFKMFAGVSPETLELFGEMLGLEEQGDAASHQAFQTYLKVAKNNRSAMKRLIERKGIAGFSEDAGRVLAGFVYSNARQTSQNLNAGEMTESLLAIKENERTEGELYDTASKLLDYIRNPQEEAGAFRGLLFAQYLGGNAASAIVNATQPIMVSFPYLSQFGGVAKAAAQMTQATKDALAKTTGSAELDAALKKAEADGIVSPQEVHHLMAQAAGRAQLQAGDGTIAGDAAAKVRNAIAKGSLAWGKVFSVAEQFNRRTTFIAAYRIGKENGVEDAFAFAERAVVETQFNYSKAGRPRWARGAIGSTLFTFKTYSVSYVELLHRMYTRGGPEGKRATLLALAMLFLVSGLDGLPGSEDLEDVVDGLLQRLGFNFSSAQRKREFLAGVLGEDGAQFLLKGISGLPGAPIDLSGRMGLGNLIPATGLLTRKADYSRDALELIGPAGDFTKRIGQSASQLLGGEVGRAVLTVLPTAARNLEKGYDMASQGMYRDDRGRKVIDTDATEAALKAIGFQPNNVARVQEASATVQQLTGLNKLMESEISLKWSLGVFERNPAKVAEARDMLRQWNEDNPSSPIAINSMQIRKRVRQMSMSKAERLAKTAPKEIRESVRQELAR